MASTIAALTAGGGGVATTADSSGNLDLISGTTTVLALTATGIAVTGTLSASGVTTNAAGTAALPSITTTGDTNTGIFFPAADTIAFSEGGAEAMRIDSSGNVGIGTSSPQAKFVTNTTLDGSQAIFTGAQSTNEQTLLLRNQYYTNNSTAGVAAIGWIDSGASGGILTFKTGTNGGGTTNIPTERMRIDSSGNLLVGTTGVIAGSNAIGQFSNVNAGRPGIAVGNSVGSSATNAIIFINSNGTVGSIQTSGSATSYNTSSDYRLKNTIAPMTGALAKVALLKPCTYKWNADGSDGQGFIAHELQEVVEGCVTGEKDATREEEYEVSPAVPAVLDAEGVETTPAVQAVKGTRTVPSYQGIDTSFLVATLTAAIQEAHALIIQLQADVAALKGVK